MESSKKMSAKKQLFFILLVIVLGNVLISLPTQIIGIAIGGLITGYLSEKISNNEKMLALLHKFAFAGLALIALLISVWITTLINWEMINISTTWTPNPSRPWCPPHLISILVYIVGFVLSDLIGENE